MCGIAAVITVVAAAAAADVVIVNFAAAASATTTRTSVVTALISCCRHRRVGVLAQGCSSASCSGPQHSPRAHNPQQATRARKPIWDCKRDKQRVPACAWSLCDGVAGWSLGRRPRHKLCCAFVIAVQDYIFLPPAFVATTVDFFEKHGDSLLSCAHCCS